MNGDPYDPYDPRPKMRRGRRGHYNTICDNYYILTFKEKDASGKSKAVTISRKDGINFQKEGTLLQKSPFLYQKKRCRN